MEPIKIKPNEEYSLKTMVRKLNETLPEGISALVADRRLCLMDNAQTLAFEDCPDNTIELIWDETSKKYWINPELEKTDVVFRKRVTDKSVEYIVFLVDCPSEEGTMLCLSKIHKVNENGEIKIGEVIEGHTNRYDYIFSQTVEADAEDCKEILEKLSEKGYTNLRFCRNRTSNAIVKFTRRHRYMLHQKRQQEAVQHIKEQAEKQGLNISGEVKVAENVEDAIENITESI